MYSYKWKFNLYYDWIENTSPPKKVIANFNLVFEFHPQSNQGLTQQLHCLKTTFNPHIWLINMMFY